MRLLAFDSSGEVCTAAAWDTGRPAEEALLGHRRADLGRGHAETLIPLLQELLEACAWGFERIDVIVPCHGPGSFTGVRVAVAAARAFALAAGRPVLAVSALEALAEAAGPDERPLLAAIDARRGELYLQAFGPDLATLGEPRVAPPGDALEGLRPPLRVVGSGAPLVRAAARLPEHAIELLDRPLDARHVASRAVARIAAGEAPIPGPQLRPLHLRAADARPQAGMARARR
jgi:tRNA threonylcarbamoyladenosine biosynthesis protein TsaB